MSRKSATFVVFLLLFSLVMFVFNFDNEVNIYNSTLLGLSYENGILPRALVGTAYSFMNHILPFELLSYNSVLIYTFIITLFFVVFWCLIQFYFLKKVESDYTEYVEYVIVFISIFVISTFTAFDNYGRLDVYIVALTVLSTVILISGKCEWLIIPISVTCILIHEGYVFMYYNVILVLLLYKILTAYKQKQKKEMRKYAFIFLFSFVLVCIVFIYYTFIYNGNMAAYENTVNAATALSQNGEYHKEVIRAEVLGENLFAEEWELYHKGNFVEILIFLVLFLPFLIIQIKFLVSLVKKADDKIEKLKYLAFALGSVTTLPLFILKVDYGRWVLAVLVYYCLVLIALIAMGDKKVGVAWKEEVEDIRQKTSYGKLLLVYAMLFVPLKDFNICWVTRKILNLMM
ncbi:MAG: hypothetical protein K5644_02185 [Lachnospiraceae bacterium]|nr:hypothetical protein [Lachnospiraceae bacterium]